MSAFHLRFVGATELPRLLSEFDVEQSFRLSSEDVVAVRERFRSNLRLGAALQLVFLRATDRPLDRLANIPRTLLRSLCLSLCTNNMAIASLKTIYKRRTALYDRQKWAREISGLCRF